MLTTFTVSVPRRKEHLYDILMEADPRGAREIDLVLPAWTPGSYLIRDFSRHVGDLAATDRRGRRLPIEKVEKARWRVSLGAISRGPVRVRYRVYAHDLTVRTSHLDDSHAYGNGASLFFYVEGRKDEPQRLRFVLPRGWKVSIALPRRGGRFLAADYDELLDSPFECGTHRTLDFAVLGVPHTLALRGSGNENERRLVRDLGRVVREAASLFGGLPYERYLFIAHLHPGASGGLEHRASQTVGIDPWKFGRPDDYRETLRVFAHELFHAWNVKRIRPQVLGPFDYTKEVYTRDLWAMEGITCYYQELLLLRAGLQEPKHLFKELAKQLRAHEETPGSRVQSAEMASFDAWIRQYRPDENSPNVAESYYRRGALLGCALDLTIRRATKGRRSLDDVLRLLDRRYAARGRGYPVDAFEVAASEIARQNLKPFFERYVRGVARLPVARLLGAAGLKLVERRKDEQEPGVIAELGWKMKAENGRLKVAEVYAGGAAAAGGIAPGDELVAFDGFRADEEQLDRLRREARAGEGIAVTLFRLGRLRTLRVRPRRRRDVRYEMVADRRPPAAARSLFRGWLGRPFPKPELPSA